MIYLLTGQNGHGKTLYTLKMALDFQKEGRTVYSHGIPGERRDLTGFLPLDDPLQWEQLPDNSVIVIDECYSTFPNRNAASKVPPHVEAMARHRHRGFDFILTCQKPDQLDPFLAGLIEEHRHVRRKSKMLAVIKTWDRIAKDPIKDKADSLPVWRYDTGLYQLYKSATIHTSRRALPWWLYAAVPLLLFTVWGFYRVASGETFEASASASDVKPPAHVPGAQATGAGAGGGVVVAGKSDAERADYAKWMEPRIPGVPWSAPAYDRFQVSDVAGLFCMASEAGLDGNGDQKPASCTCHTEQATRLDVEPELCRTIARQGLYNPFKKTEVQRNVVGR